MPDDTNLPTSDTLAIIGVLVDIHGAVIELAACLPAGSVKKEVFAELTTASEGIKSLLASARQRVEAAK